MEASIITRSNVQIIPCPKTRCNGCGHNKGNKCLILSSPEDIGQKYRVRVIVERSKRVLHIWTDTLLRPNNPPWHSEGWESIYYANLEGLVSEISQLIDLYRVGPYLSLFFTKNDSEEINHKSLPTIRTPLEHGLLDEQITYLEDEYSSEHYKRNIEEAIDDRAAAVSKRILRDLPEIGQSTNSNLSQIAAFESSVLNLLLPILLDDDVEEVFLDRPGDSVYFDHATYGRVISDDSLSESDLSKMITFFRAVSNLHLDQKNPSLKTDINIYGINLRVSISVPPLSPDGTHFEIRRAKENPFTVYDLIRNMTLTPEVAALLLLAVHSRMNITITGEPGTGKTTLLNALDMTTPKPWRKIYIEDAVESRFMGSQHQVRIRVDPVDEQKERFDKATEITKSLHRSPDYLILGEIQTAEHSKALFQAISAGLKTMQTCHSDSATNLVSRWITAHNIPTVNISMMDLIVTLERPIPGKSKRVVTEVSEIRRVVNNGLVSFVGISQIYRRTRDIHDARFAEDGAFRDKVKVDNLDGLDSLVLSLAENLFNEAKCDGKTTGRCSEEIGTTLAMLQVISGA